jgi:hypothetical protein
VPSDAVRIDWQRRVAAEYAVSAFAQDFAMRLTMFGAPIDLIEQALVMALDELAHATHAAEVALIAGATGTPTFDPGEYINETHADPALHIVVAAVPSLCLGEILALRIVHHMRDGAREPIVRTALDRIVGDEPRHTALGWETLDWLLDTTHAPSVRSCVESALPEWFERLRAGFAGEYPEPHLRDLTDDDRAWGLVPVEEVRDVFESTVERDWIPRLERRGLRVDQLRSIKPIS